MKPEFGIQSSEFGKLMRFGACLLLGVFFLPLNSKLQALNAAFAQPITTDSRIKTFVYNPNEVFAVTTHYGYQSNVEFGPKEVIDTISVGDRVAWQIIPAGGRLFIRAMEENARTNMTVVTNFRAYQFDLRSSPSEAVFGSEQLTYVIRFYYPPQTMSDAATDAMPNIAPPPVVPPIVTRPLAPAPATTTPVTMAPTAPVPVAAAPAPVVTNMAPAPSVTVNMPAPMPAAPVQVTAAPIPPAPVTQPVMDRSALNYRYTFSGPNDIAPTKIFDDGKTTYFKLPSSQKPEVVVINTRGEALPVAARRTPDGMLAVDAVGPQFRLRQRGRDVIVYNETGGEVL